MLEGLSAPLLEVLRADRRKRRFFFAFTVSCGEPEATSDVEDVVMARWS